VLRTFRALAFDHPMTTPKELPAGTESDQAIVRRTTTKSLARSAKDIQRDQVVVLDDRGVAMERSTTTRWIKLFTFGFLGAQIAGPLLCLAGAWLSGSLLYFGSLAFLLQSKYRGGGTLMAVETLIREGHLDEAQKRFDAVPELRRRNRLYYCWLAGNLASSRGNYEPAITWWREALGKAKGLPAERLKLSITKALLLLGRVKEARLQFETVTLPLEADEVLTSMTLARVMRVLCDPDLPPAEDDLHDWARKSLEYSHTGVELAAIGWAFDKLGDQDMATFLATEAKERMHFRYLATWWPALQQWLEARQGTLPEDREPDEQQLANEHDDPVVP
jgi:tetratricopeptide (TPR) repeat protein